MKASSRKDFLYRMGLLALVPVVGNVKAAHGVGEKVESGRLKVLTCNIRVDLPEDSVKGVGWLQRKQACIEVIKKQKADIISFQEVLENQFLDLKEAMSEYFGFGFDGPEMDVRKNGYHGIAKNPIFFSKKRFDLLTGGTFWLSETPLVASSISWGSARARHAVWIRLYDKLTKKQFRVINLHLDHVSDEAKINQISIVLEEADQYRSDFPQILTGDFNVTSDSVVVGQVMKFGWKDSFVVKSEDDKLQGTAHGFKGESKEKMKKIDFIFMKGGINAIRSVVLKDTYKGQLPSDHYFVSAELIL